ncbi:uncharacterized protein LOC110453056 [Mizuhopecten yessoensis]|uniref:uncharacterized protein LOC110453056 n=1 Tax=Mizuhopecten yessoensis TaxID=6573 RepID=UPI000B45D31B|nr:uncharacterized protein LOC110453056 [Mizuhopecten yessoensis]
MHNECDIRDITMSEVIQQNKEKSVPRCDTHDKKLSLFCESHRLLGCNICIIKEHRLCEKVKTATEYYNELKAATRFAVIQVALKEGEKAMELLIKEFDEQLKTMVHNQETFEQSVEDTRERVGRRLDKLQKAVTDELARLFNEEKRNIETTSRQCERLLKSMLNTMKSSNKAVKENDNIETIVLYQRGRAEVESFKALFTEISKSFTSVSMKHEIVPDLVDNAFGKVVIEKQTYSLMLGRRAKRFEKVYIQTPSDSVVSNARGVLFLQDDQILISESNNKKLKLFTDNGQFLDELVVEGDPCDVCLVDNHTVAASVYSPGGVHIVKVEDSKLLLSSEINMPIGKHCYGITHTNGT